VKMQGTDSFAATLAALARTIELRRREGDPEQSWVARLLAGGPQRCAKKLGEEAVESALACAAGTRQEFLSESADLLFHLLVALAARDLSLEEVGEELARRQGVSGIAEKAARADIVRGR